MNDLPPGLLKPCRAYQLVKDPTTGEEWQSLVVWPRQYIELSEGNFITNSEITELSKKFPFLLNDSDVQLLSTSLNIMRVTDHATDEHVVRFDHNNLLERTLKNIATLSNDLPKVIQVGRDSGQNRGRATADLLSNLLEIVNRVTADLPPQGPKPTRVSSWHDDAECLYDILHQAAEREGAVIGFRNPDTLGVKFIASALTRAGVKYGKAEAISQFFNRRMSNRRTTKKV